MGSQCKWNQAPISEPPLPFLLDFWCISGFPHGLVPIRGVRHAFCDLQLWSTTRPCPPPPPTPRHWHAWVCNVACTALCDAQASVCSSGRRPCSHPSF